MFKYFLILVLIYSSSVNAQDKQLTGIIEGTVLDKETKLPLIAANVMLENSTIGATTDAEGKFVIKSLNVGSYSIKISYMGYQLIIKTDVIVKSSRSTALLIELQPSAYQTEEINVNAGYFTEVEYQTVNSVNFSYEEIRRSPGAAGDVSRIMMSLPSVAKVNDQSNSLIVRGGSPLENAFYIDNIEIPNINHFPTQGASGGPIGVLNVDFINDVNFISGGFSSTFGDKLSSIMDIKFREGNRENIEGQLDFNFAGFGGVIEGPIGNNGSYMLSLRRSYFDLLVKSIDIGTSIPPSYGDYQYKIVYDLNDNNKLSLIGVVSDDHNNPTQKAAIDEDMIYYGPQKIWVHTNGINWQKIWGKIGYSNTSIAFTSNLFNETYYETGSGLFLRKNDSYENELKIRNINYLRLFTDLSITFGADYKWLKSNYNNQYGKYTDALGNATPEVLHITNFDEHKIGLFEEIKVTDFKSMDLSIGLREDYFTYNKRLNFSPRLALNLKFDDVSSIKAFAGVFYQTLPSLLLSQNENNKNLKNTTAYQYILGYERLLTKDLRLTLDLYYKKYKDLPIDPTQPQLFLLDELYYRSGYYFNHEQLISSGSAYTKGIELMLQKKLAENIYGLASVSYSIAKCKSADNIWQNRVYDNRIVATIEGGYKPNNEWEFSLRWVYAGGTPYTPLNISESETLNRAVLDENRINAERYPDYHSLNLRVDKRYHFEHLNIVAYLSVWNAYSRKNIATYFWNETKKEQGTIYQWTLLPIFGVEIEF